MNKTELIEAVAKRAGLTKVDATKAVDATFGIIHDTLKEGGDVKLLGFGNFEVTDRAAKTGRNPQTGQEIQVAAKKAPKFKPGKTLKDAVAGA